MLTETTNIATGYELRLYESKYLDGVVDLLGYLLGADREANRSFFRWKYVDNPFADRPLGIVALNRGEVVGCRGYFCTNWQIPARDTGFALLSPGDTVVHPDHRKKGLSVAMGRLGMEEYQRDYRLFLNTSAGGTSTPGYLKMGFVPLATKAYWSQYSLARFLIERKLLKSRHRPHVSKVQYGEFGDIVVCDQPCAETMSKIANGQSIESDKIALRQDEPYFRWRFGTNRSKCIFYYLRQGGDLVAYVVIGVRHDATHGRVIDYGETVAGSIVSILKHIKNVGHFDILDVAGYAAAGQFGTDLQSLGFKPHSLLRRRRRTKWGEWPLLIRPTVKDVTDHDWFVEGLDTRDLGNWNLKEVCHDGL